MTSVEALYQALILEHSRHPRRFGPLADASHRASGNNPFCGDAITVAVRIDGERIQEIRFQGEGCVIAVASASLMTDALASCARPDAEALAHRFCRFVGGDPVEGELGPLAAFAPVAQFPARVECARLAWQTFLAAVDGAAMSGDVPF